MAEEDISFIRFLVQYRSEVQEACRDLLILIDDPSKRPLLNPESAEWEMCGLLSGAAFSLWRAVFTVRRGVAVDQTGLQATEDFLVNLIGTNAVGFQQEQNSWSYGYYLNNARFRLADAYMCVPRNLRARYRDDVAAISRMVQWKDRGEEEYPEYQSTHGIFMRFVSLLNEQMNSADFVPWPATGRKDRLWIDNT